MKKNIVGAIVATVTFTVIYLLLDLIFGDTHSFREYAVQAVIFCFVWCLGRFLDERGWNSWKRIGDLFKRKKTEMYAGWTFHSGNRMTLPDQVIAKPDGYGGYDYSAIYSSPNNAILPAYHRLDVGFNFHNTTRRGNEAIWNLSVYNAYCHMNAINAYVTFKYDQEHHGSGPLSSYSEMQGWIPIIPTFSYTLKF